jgi:hypothetical protein
MSGGHAVTLLPQAKLALRSIRSPQPLHPPPPIPSPSPSDPFTFPLRSLHLPPPTLRSPRLSAASSDSKLKFRGSAVRRDRTAVFRECRTAEFYGEPPSGRFYCGANSRSGRLT